MIPFILTIVGGYLIGDSMKDEKSYADGGSVGDMKIKDVPKVDIYESPFNSVDVSVYYPAPNENISIGLGRVSQDFDEIKKKYKKNSFTAEKFVVEEIDSEGVIKTFHIDKIGTFKTLGEAKEALLNSNVDKKLLDNVMSTTRKLANGGPVDKPEIDIYKEDDERSYTGRSSIKVYYTKGDIGFDGRLKEYHTGIGWEMEFEPDYFDDKESENYYDEHSDAIEEEILAYFYSNDWENKKMADGGSTDDGGQRLADNPNWTNEELLAQYNNLKISLEDLKEGKITPRKVIGGGYKSSAVAKRVAKEWLGKEITKYARALKIRGVMAEGGSIAESNNRMLRSKVKEVKHHADELGRVVKPKTEVEGWVVAKAERSASDLSDITHYLDGAKK